MLTISKYQAGQLSNLLGDLQGERASGSVYINITVDSAQRPRSYVLVIKNGEIVYGGLKIPDNNQEFAKMLGIKFGYSWAEAAIRYTARKLNNPSSFRELLERIVGIKVFKWEEIEAAIQAQVVQVLEQTLDKPGELRLESILPFDLSYGEDGHYLDWSKLSQDIKKRQEEWVALTPFVSSINAIPRLFPSRLQAVSDPKVQQHLQEWVDGVRSLLDIAEEIGEDPLKLAQSYRTWVISDWVTFGEDITKYQCVSENQKQLPIVLSVDDSVIVQTMIKRALCDRYQVLLASNAVDALKLINTNSISLLLLDVTMPDIDGLEFCRTVRSIEKLKQLPVIMITARDKFSDKLRGQIAGATYYLIKPVEPKLLIETVDKYVEVNKS
jgi:twitching motility two-component system response regulator PilG